MKRIILTALIGLLSYSCFAQFSLKLGADYSTLTGNADANYRFGFHVGPVYDFQLTRRIFLQPGLLLGMHSFGLKPEPAVVEGKVERYILEVPVVFSFRQPTSKEYDIRFDLGLYGKYGLGGDYSYTHKDRKVASGSTFDHFNRFDMGLNVGIGAGFRKMFAGLSYQYSLTNARKNASGHHFQNLRISIGYRFM